MTVRAGVSKLRTIIEFLVPALSWRAISCASTSLLREAATLSVSMSFLPSDVGTYARVVSGKAGFQLFRTRLAIRSDDPNRKLLVQCIRRFDWLLFPVYSIGIGTAGLDFMSGAPDPTNLYRVAVLAGVLYELPILGCLFVRIFRRSRWRSVKTIAGIVLEWVARKAVALIPICGLLFCFGENQSYLLRASRHLQKSSSSVPQSQEAVAVGQERQHNRTTLSDNAITSF